MLGECVCELVLLLRDPIPMDAEFVRDAVLGAFSVSLPMDDPEAAEFVTGEYPIFFVQLRGRLLQVKSMPLPYFDPEARPFVTGDPDLLLREVRDPKLQKRIDRHRGWISVALMDQPKGAGDGWAYVGKMLGAFGYFDARVLLRPDTGQMVCFEDHEMQEFLEGGEPLEIFNR